MHSGDEQQKTQLWQDQARHFGGVEFLNFLLQVRDTQMQMVDEMKRFNNAFPEGDPESHRRYHESVIEWRELRNKLVRAALEKMVSAGALAGTVWLLYAVWHALRMELNK